jgi:hypothetical protein
VNDIAEYLKVAARMLMQSSTDDWSQVESGIDTPVRSILIRMSEIIRGASDIAASKNPTALSILSRQLLESFISLHWVISAPERAEKYSQFKSNEFKRVAQILMKEGLLQIKAKDDDTDVTREYLSNQEKPQKGVPIEQQARQSGIIDVYQMFYRLMSLDTHGKSETVIDSQKQEECTLIHLEAIGAISKASGHVAVLWLLNRKRVDNEKLRDLLGLNQ